MVKIDLEKLQNVLILQNISVLEFAELDWFTILFNSLKCSQAIIKSLVNTREKMAGVHYSA